MAKRFYMPTRIHGQNNLIGTPRSRASPRLVSKRMHKLTTYKSWILKNYISIACLPTTFKILTSILTDSIYSHLEKQAVVAPEQM